MTNDVERYILKTVICFKEDKEIIEDIKYEYEHTEKASAELNDKVIKPIAIKEFKDDAEHKIHIEMLYEYKGDSLMEELTYIDANTDIDIIKVTLDVMSQLEGKLLYHPTLRVKLANECL